MEHRTHDYNRPNILKLCTKISLESLTYTGITYNDSEYVMFDTIVDDEMCEIMMHLKLETPRTVEEIARRAKKDVEYTGEQIKKLLWVGAIRETESDGVLKYHYTVWVPGIMEDVLGNTELCNKYPILGECFEEYTRKRISVLAPMLDRGMCFMRVMPVDSSIQSETRKAEYDEVHRLVENATAISVGPCSCRRSRRLMGEGCGHLEKDMCIYLNENALAYIKTGKHRAITKEEAYEILKNAEDNGLVHEVDQTLGFNEAPGAICNCCGCSCYSLRIANMFRKPDGIRSNYKAVIDRDKCVACGQCVENCQTNALKLGTKLCEIKPTEVKDEHIPEKKAFINKKTYNVNYRENRSDVVATGTAPCKTACPAHISVQGYLRLAAEGRYIEALELIKKENPFPAVCGRICNKKCEEACTRASVDEAVAIDDIKKFIAEKDLDSKTRFVPKMLNQIGRAYPEKIAVIGAGPAGLSCAYYLAVKGYPVTVFEKEKALGGMLTLGIPSFRLEKDVINSEIDVLKELGVEFKCGVEVGKDLTLDSLRAEGYKAFYLAVGAQKGAKMGVAGEELQGVFSGIEFLKAVNLGEKPDIGKKCVVIGGGNVAIDVARAAARLGADVTVCYRRKESNMPADPEEVAEAKAEGVKFLFEHKPVEIKGENGKAVKLICENDECEIDSVIAAIGQQIDVSAFDIEVGEKGNVLANAKTYQTSVLDVFAGGDAVTGPKFAIDAIAAGKEASISIHRYVHEGQTLTFGRDNRDYKAIDKENISFSAESFDLAPRQKAVCGTAEDAKKTFKDLRGTLTEEQIKKEAGRCLSCGAVVIDEYMCVGCGICTTKCKFDAIHLERVTDACGKAYFKNIGSIYAGAPAKIGKVVANKIKFSRK